MANSTYTINDLLYVMARLRDPETGCPWDLQQNAVSLAPFTLEEAYEVVDAIERQDQEHLPEELGDLLFQVIFHSQLGVEENVFSFADVVDKLVAKLVSRHPHVFPAGTMESVRDSDVAVSTREINANWEQKKQLERTSKGRQGHLADIPVALPALTRAQKVQKRAAKVGFDWDNIGGVIDKVREEIAELENELPDNDPGRVADELGDLFFSLVNLARHLHVDAETSLRNATCKFERRFGVLEGLALSSGESLSELSQVELDQYWNRAKALLNNQQ